MAAKLVIECGGELKFPGDFVDLDMVTCEKHNGVGWQTGDFINTVMTCRDTHCLVLVGPPGLAKTPCGRSIADLWSRSAGCTYYIKTSTVDSLKKVCEAGHFQKGVCVMLDEWRPKSMAVGSQGGGIDFLKHVCDVQNPQTMAARFQDFAFENGMSRVITCQKMWDMAEMCGDDEDAQAIFKRCIFARPNVPMLHFSKIVEFECEKSKVAFESISKVAQNSDGSRVDTTFMHNTVKDIFSDQ